jgi:hypothetical protein
MKPDPTDSEGKAIGEDDRIVASCKYLLRFSLLQN